ncbi:MAG: hypothetical protein V4709_13525 [Pseudomonadota bacterium]
MSPHSLRSRQTGAALGIALLILLIITILGVAAVRATQVELKLSQNAESRMAATQAAQSMVAFVSDPTNMPVNDNLGHHVCVRATGVTVVPACDSATTTIVLTGISVPLLKHGYAEVRREQPLFVEVNVLRALGSELSAKNYDFARFTATGGYDRSSDGMSAAEITEGILKLHSKVAGVHYETE